MFTVFENIYRLLLLSIFQNLKYANPSHPCFFINNHSETTTQRWDVRAGFVEDSLCDEKLGKVLLSSLELVSTELSVAWKYQI